MKRIKTLVAVVFLLGCSVTVNAQLGGLVKNAKKGVSGNLVGISINLCKSI